MKSTLQNSFIANVNLLVSNLTSLKDINSKFTKEEVDALTKLSNIDIKAIIDDLEKGTYDGERKLDIDLFKNYKDYSSDMSIEDKNKLYSQSDKAPKYNAITVYFGLVDSYKLIFKQDNLNINITTNQELYEQLVNSKELEDMLEFTAIGSFPIEVSKNLVRFYDNKGRSNVSKVVLHLTSDSTVLSKGITSYSWYTTTSVLQFLVGYIDTLIKLYSKLPDLGLMAEMVSKALDELKRLGEYYSSLIKEYADKSEEAWNNLANASAEAISVPNDKPAKVTLDKGKFTFEIPRAKDGKPPIGLSLANFDVTDSGHLQFTVHQCDFSSCDASINEKGELVLELKDTNE